MYPEARSEFCISGFQDFLLFDKFNFILENCPTPGCGEKPLKVAHPET